MDSSPELKRLADSYAAQGYDVVVGPGPDRLPPFAKDFSVEIAGRRGTEGVLVAVRRNREEFAADRDIPRYAEVTGTEPGWRFDFAILEAEDPEAADVRGAQEFSGEDIDRSLAQAGQLADMGFARLAVIGAWAALEAAMRMRLRVGGGEAGGDSPPRQMLRELYSAGALSPDEFRRIDAAARLRNQIIHGFTPRQADGEGSEAAVVRLLGDVARRLLRESQQPVKQSA